MQDKGWEDTTNPEIKQEEIEMLQQRQNEMMMKNKEDERRFKQEERAMMKKISVMAEEYKKL